MRLATYGSESQYCDHLEALTAELRARGVEVVHYHGYQNRRKVEGSPVLVASRKDAMWMDPAKVILIEHGAGQRYNRDAGGADVEVPNVVMFLAPSQRVADNGRVLYPRAGRLAVGSPRVEQLAALARSPEYVITAWHWNMPGAVEGKGAWDRYKVAARDLARLYPVLGHGHPREHSLLKREHEELRISWEPSWPECVKVASMLVCDNSSIMWEACALDIPLVVVNAPWYRRDINWGLRFWEFADVGPNVDNPTQLVEAVEQVMAEDRWKDRRAEAAAYCYGQIEGSTARAADAVLSLL